MSQQTNSPAPSPTTVKDFLKPENLARLRKAFKGHDAEMIPAAQAGFTQFHSSTNPYIDGVLKTLYSANAADEALKVKETGAKNYEQFLIYRELIVTTTLVTQTQGLGLKLGIHLYWSLMVGLAPAQLADQMLIIGIYNGISTLSNGFDTLKLVLTGLNTLVENTPVAQDESALSVLAVLAKMPEWFPG
jgi:hypothetical protein